jgi:recombinational DNA repair ATPase RecF
MVLTVFEAQNRSNFLDSSVGLTTPQHAEDPATHQQRRRTRNVMVKGEIVILLDK